MCRKCFNSQNTTLLGVLYVQKMIKHNIFYCVALRFLDFTNRRLLSVNFFDKKYHNFDLYKGSRQLFNDEKFPL